MTHSVSFMKVSGAGNDFVLVNDLKGELPLDWSAFARAVCQHHNGVGADGLVVIRPAIRTAYTMLYFNADGSSGAMCGNGGRCAARYAFESGIAPSEHTFEACGDLYHARMADPLVVLSMKQVCYPPRKVELTLDDQSVVTGYFLDTGSPQVVIPVDDVEQIDVATLGRSVRHHGLLRPAGANVNFTQDQDDGSIRVRTFERGVEAETLACGTGVVASALMTPHQEGVQARIAVFVRSGEKMEVSFERLGDRFINITLTGTARFVFRGTLKFDQGTGHLASVNLLEFPDPA